MASFLDEPPAVQIRRLQTENRLLQTENCGLQGENVPLHSENRRFRTEKGSPLEREEEANVDHFWPENFYLPVDEAFLTMVEKLAGREVEKRAEKEEEGEDEADRLRSECNDMQEALRIAMAQCESLRLELDEKTKSDDADERFAQLVEARIARNKAEAKMEDCMAYSKSLEERLRRQERAVQVVCSRARRMLERVKELAEDDAPEAEAPENVEEADEKWIRVLMRPLEEEMEKIESSFSVKR